MKFACTQSLFSCLCHPLICYFPPSRISPPASCLPFGRIVKKHNPSVGGGVPLILFWMDGRPKLPIILITVSFYFLFVASLFSPSTLLFAKLYLMVGSKWFYWSLSVLPTRFGKLIFLFFQLTDIYVLCDCFHLGSPLYLLRHNSLS